MRKFLCALLLLTTLLMVGCGANTSNTENTESENVSQVEEQAEFVFLDESVTCLNIKVGSTGQAKIISDRNEIQELDALLAEVEFIEKEEIEDITNYPIRNALYIIECINEDKEIVSSIYIYPDKIALDEETWIAEQLAPVNDYIDVLFE